MWKALSVIAALLVAGAAFLSFLNKADVETERELLATAKSNFEEISARFNEVQDAKAVAKRKTDKMEVRRDEAIGVRDAKEQELADKKAEVEEAKRANAALEMEVDENDKQIAEFGNAQELITIINGLKTDTIAARTGGTWRVTARPSRPPGWRPGWPSSKGPRSRSPAPCP